MFPVYLVSNSQFYPGEFFLLIFYRCWIIWGIETEKRRKSSTMFSLAEHKLSDNTVQNNHLYISWKKVFFLHFIITHLIYLCIFIKQGIAPTKSCCWWVWWHPKWCRNVGEWHLFCQCIQVGQSKSGIASELTI